MYDLHKCYTEVAILSCLVTKDGGDTSGANEVRHCLAVQEDLGQVIRGCSLPSVVSNRDMLSLDI